MARTYYLLFAFSTVVIALLTSCSHEKSYPQQLVMADSAYMEGNYQLADALLETSKNQIDWKNAKEANYYKLITLEKAFVGDKLSSEHFSLVDSLRRFYKKEDDTSEKYAKSLLFIADIYQRSKDYPSSLNYFLHAKDLAQKKDVRLFYIISRKIGDQYFGQGMYKDCIPLFQQYNELATAYKDTLRMAYGADRMAKVYTIKNNVDSTIYFYERAIKLAEGLPEKERIVPTSKSNLCDIYIQTEEFDKALEVMPRNELNDANWAYWHYGQHHLDSAAYYFKKTLGRFKWQGETEVLRILAEIERERGDLNASLDYYKQLAVAEDSLKVQQRAEETMRVNAQYNYSSIQQQRDELEHRNRDMSRLVWLLLVVVAAVVAMAIVMWRLYLRRKEAALARQQLLEQEKEALKEQSQQRLEENNQRLAELERALADAHRQNDTQATERLTMDTRVLESQNKSIEAVQQRRRVLLQELHATSYYQRLKSPDPSVAKQLSAAEWEDLSTRLDDIYNGFTSRLLSLARLSETELRICRLVKIDVQRVEIADIIFKSKSAVTHARKRMYKKLTKTDGSAEDFDALIQDL